MSKCCEFRAVIEDYHSEKGGVQTSMISDVIQSTATSSITILGMNTFSHQNISLQTGPGVPKSIFPNVRHWKILAEDGHLVKSL